LVGLIGAAMGSVAPATRRERAGYEGTQTLQRAAAQSARTADAPEGKPGSCRGVEPGPRSGVTAVAAHLRPWNVFVEENEQCVM